MDDLNKEFPHVLTSPLTHSTILLLSPPKESYLVCSRGLHCVTRCQYTCAVHWLRHTALHAPETYYVNSVSLCALMKHQQASDAAGEDVEVAAAAQGVCAQDINQLVDNAVPA